MVEMAVAMPLLLTLLLGFVDFSYLFYQWNAGNKAVQTGARVAQVSTPVAIGLPSEGKTPVNSLDVAMLCRPARMIMSALQHSRCRLLQYRSRRVPSGERGPDLVRCHL